jgi:hypothetical protein
MAASRWHNHPSLRPLHWDSLDGYHVAREKLLASHVFSYLENHGPQSMVVTRAAGQAPRERLLASVVMVVMVVAAVVLVAVQHMLRMVVHIPVLLPAQNPGLEDSNKSEVAKG